MIGPQLQKALYDALTGAGVASGRVYDRVPDNPVFPYVTIGDEQVIDDGNTCQDGWEVYPTVHVWGRDPSGSRASVKAMMAQAVTAVLSITSVTGFVLVASQLQDSRVDRDPDGLTDHAVATFKFILDPA
jgi:hypothetical protein